MGPAQTLNVRTETLLMACDNIVKKKGKRKEKGKEAEDEGVLISSGCTAAEPHLSLRHPDWTGEHRNTLGGTTLVGHLRDKHILLWCLLVKAEKKNCPPYPLHSSIGTTV